MKNDTQRKFVINLLDEMIIKVKNGSYVPTDDIRTMLSMQSRWVKGKFYDEMHETIQVEKSDHELE